MSFPDLRSYLKALSLQGELKEISAPVEAHLEIAEIHRRVISEGGPALLFRNVRNSDYPLVSNLFGTKERVDLAFGRQGPEAVERLSQAVSEFVGLGFDKLWSNKGLLGKLLKIGLKTGHRLGSDWTAESPPDLEALPFTTSWPKDGGAFLTLPLVYTEHPQSRGHNLGIYRMQRFGRDTLGFHAQIAKGAGFHLAQAKELGQSLPVNVFLGGPPAVLLAAVTPLPENVPELLWASLLLGQKLRLKHHHLSALGLLDSAEFIISGTVNPDESRAEGPFGDHYGYYSLQHDFPVFRAKTLFRKKDAVFPATVVGKPRQEDYYIGNYIQEALSPLFGLVMPSIKTLWSYGETGFHSLAAAVTTERYKREALVSAFRILGEGQLSLTKFLLIVDKEMNLRDFSAVLEYVLRRADFRTDLYVFSHTSMDTLDYAGPRLNEGSKGLLIGMGEPVRDLPTEFSQVLPQGLDSACVFCPGCLVLSGPAYRDEPELPGRLLSDESFSDWPLIVLVDNAQKATNDVQSFLWTTFTRFEPAADIHSAAVELRRFHPELAAPILIDARMKPTYPDEVECDAETKALVDRRWGEYFA